MADLAPTAAIADLQALAARFKNLIDLIPKLEAIKSLEDYANELKTNIKKLEDAQDVAKGNLAEAESEVQLARDSVAVVVTRAEEQAKSLLADAKVQAEEMRLASRESASKEVLELQTQKVQKQEEIDALQDRVNTLMSDLEAAQSSYDKLTAAINDLKAKF